jgi:outer membrane protein TolC
VLAGTLRLQEARLRDVEEQFRNGLAIKLSVAQTRAQVNGTRASLIQAESDVRNGRSTLALLLGVPAVGGPLADDFAAPPPDQRPPAAEYEQSALTFREDLQAAMAAVRAARAAVDVAVAQYYPAVSLNVAGFLYREFYADASKWNAILSANLPIFSAGLIEADVRAAWSRLRQAALSESLVRRQVVNDIQVAYENLATADRRIREYREQVGTSREALEQAQNAFRNSLAINLDVLVAQDQLLNSELLLTGAEFDRTVFYLDLIRATGRLTDVSVLPSAGEVTKPATAPATRPSTLPATQP